MIFFFYSIVQLTQVIENLNKHRKKLSFFGYPRLPLSRKIFAGINVGLFFIFQLPLIHQSARTLFIENPDTMSDNSNRHETKAGSKKKKRFRTE